MAPYILGVASHKGGTGRTTCAAMIGWALGRAGHRVGLLDASVIPSLDLLTGTAEQLNWENVELLPAESDPRTRSDLEIVIVDSPSLVEPSCVDVLVKADGVLMTMLLEPMTFRTLASAIQGVEAARAANAKLALLGIVLNQVNRKDPIQKELLDLADDSVKQLLLEPFLPLLPELNQWSLTPGCEPPGVPAQRIATALAERVARATELKRELVTAGVQVQSRASRYVAERRSMRQKRQSLFARIRDAMFGN